MRSMPCSTAPPRWRAAPAISRARCFAGAPPPPCCNCRIASDALRRLGRSGTVGQGLFIGSFDVRYGVAGEPLVSVIVRSEGDADAVGRTLESLEQRSAYRRFERIVADGTLPDARTRAWYRALHERRAATVVARPGETNAAWLGQRGGAARAGAICCSFSTQD